MALQIMTAQSKAGESHHPALQISSLLRRASGSSAVGELTQRSIAEVKLEALLSSTWTAVLDNTHEPVSTEELV